MRLQQIVVGEFFALLFERARPVDDSRQALSHHAQA